MMNDAAQSLPLESSQHALSRVTEIIIPHRDKSAQIIFPLVSSMSQTHPSNTGTPQWLTWITHHKPNTHQLKQYNAHITAIRVIHVDSQKDNRWIIWEALAAGNSHTVIADSEVLSESDIDMFNEAATVGQSQGVLIRSL